MFKYDKGCQSGRILIKFRRYFRLIFAVALLCGGDAVAREDSTDFDQMVRDRPALLGVISRGDEIWNWLNSKFQSTNNLPVHWSPASPSAPTHYLSAHSYDGSGSAVIMVADHVPDGKSLQGEQILALVVFELINCTHRDKFWSLSLLAREKKLSRADYMRDMAKLEHGSCLDLQMFEIKNWIPFAVDKRLKWHDEYWMRGACQDFEKWYWYQHLAGDGYPDDVYGAYYDLYNPKGFAPLH